MKVKISSISQAIELLKEKDKIINNLTADIRKMRKLIESYQAREKKGLDDMPEFLKGFKK